MPTRIMAISPRPPGMGPPVGSGRRGWVQGPGTGTGHGGWVRGLGAGLGGCPSQERPHRQGRGGCSLQAGEGWRGHLGHRGEGG